MLGAAFAECAVYRGWWDMEAERGYEGAGTDGYYVTLAWRGESVV